MNIENVISEVEKMQQECHELVGKIMKEKAISYDAAQTIWIFTRLARIEARIDALELMNQPIG